LPIKVGSKSDSPDEELVSVGWFPRYSSEIFFLVDKVRTEA
jgi:hypothetical protein